MILRHLVDAGVVDGLGTGRARLHRVRRVHPLAGPLDALFAAEDERFEAVLAAVRREAGSLQPRPRAVWLYGSAARGTDTPASDVDLSVIAETGRPRGDGRGTPRASRTARRHARCRLFRCRR